jgi:hypothetical protein
LLRILTSGDDRAAGVIAGMAYAYRVASADRWWWLLYLALLWSGEVESAGIIRVPFLGYAVFMVGMLGSCWFLRSPLREYAGRIAKPFTEMIRMSQIGRGGSAAFGGQLEE